MPIAVFSHYVRKAAQPANVVATLWLLSAALLSCNEPDPPATGSLRVTFDNRVGAQDLALGNTDYTNASGESFRVSRFNYYVSNLKLRRTDGSEYVVPPDSSYFLIREEVPASQVITLLGVPAGTYNALTLTIGVDSLRNTMDIGRRTGVLDPGVDGHAGMYWSWNTGYIFLKLEGSSPAAPGAQNNRFFYHIGGFGGMTARTINNLRTVTIPFGTDVAAVGGLQATPTVRLTTDILKIFDGPPRVSIAQHPAVMFAPFSTTVSANYARMIQYAGMQIDGQNR